jgi:ubiquinone/menaquinone biosynthesis C-methylase UbiE
LKGFVPMLGLVFAGDAQAYRYILESLHHYPAQRGVSRKLRELGASGVHVHNFLGGAMSIVIGRKP